MQQSGRLFFSWRPAIARALRERHPHLHGRMFTVAVARCLRKAGNITFSHLLFVSMAPTRSEKALRASQFILAPGASASEIRLLGVSTKHMLSLFWWGGLVGIMSAELNVVYYPPVSALSWFVRTQNLFIMSTAIHAHNFLLPYITYS